MPEVPPARPCGPVCRGGSGRRQEPDTALGASGLREPGRRGGVPASRRRSASRSGLGRGSLRGCPSASLGCPGSSAGAAPGVPAPARGRAGPVRARRSPRGERRTRGGPPGRAARSAAAPRRARFTCGGALFPRAGAGLALALAWGCGRAPSTREPPPERGVPHRRLCSRPRRSCAGWQPAAVWAGVPGGATPFPSPQLAAGAARGTVPPCPW